MSLAAGDGESFSALDVASLRMQSSSGDHLFDAAGRDGTEEQPMAEPTKSAVVDEALATLERLGAEPWLLHHHELVAETMSEILGGLLALFPLELDQDLVLRGAALHDAGKVLHQGEMSGPGREHEAAGEVLLLEAGVPAEVARFCRTHGGWDRDTVALEDLLVALADTLWKGQRRRELEEKIVDLIVTRAGCERWNVFVEADNLFEDIADRGPERLARSRIGQPP